MLSYYFKIKTQSERFKSSLADTLFALRESRVLIYGAGQGFVFLNDENDIIEKLNIVAIADKKFQENADTKFLGIKAINPNEIINEVYDYILVMNERSKPIKDYLKSELNIDEDKIKCIFVDSYKDECDNVNYLYQNRFDKKLPKLIKKLKDKKVVLYGAGAFMSAINDYFDLSGLNVIGIVDKQFQGRDGEMKYLGYKSYSPEKIKWLAPDYVLICTKYYLDIAVELQDEYIKDTNIKIKPLLSKSFWQLLREAIK